MSAQAVAWVWRYSAAAGATFSVHHAIADSVNDQNDWLFWLPVNRLACKARVNVHTAGEAVKRLVDLGYLEVLEPPNGRAGLYRFCFPEKPVIFDAHAGEPRGKPRRTPRDPAGSKTPTARETASTARETASPCNSYLTSSNSSTRSPDDTPPATVDQLLLPLEADPFWRTHAKALERLQAGGVPDELLDPSFMATIDALTDGTGVFWDDELLKYQAWWTSQPPSGRRRARCRQFEKWLEKALASDRWKRERKQERAGTNGHGPFER